MDSLLHFERLTFPDPNNNENYSSSARPVLSKEKYSLRPRSLRREAKAEEAEERRGPLRPTNSKSHKPKQKPAPLSKYRRKTANARERNRMREINAAFETLRQVIPQMQAVPQAPANEKLTKITTLRLAMKYIASLSASLHGDGGAASPSSSYTLSEYGDLDCLLLESDGESLPLSDRSLVDASPDFPEPSLSPVDFGDPALLHTDFTEHSIEPCDFGEFLLA